MSYFTTTQDPLIRQQVLRILLMQMPDKFNVGAFCRAIFLQNTADLRCCYLQCMFYVALSGLHRWGHHLQFAAVGVTALLLLAAGWQLNEILSFPEQWSRTDLRIPGTPSEFRWWCSGSSQRWGWILPRLTNKVKAMEFQFSCSPDTGKRENNKISA